MVAALLRPNDQLRCRSSAAAEGQSAFVGEFFNGIDPEPTSRSGRKHSTSDTVS
jgi:hypothetical protein